MLVYCVFPYCTTKHLLHFISTQNQRNMQYLQYSVQAYSAYMVQKTGNCIVRLVTLDVLIRSASTLAQINAISFLT